MVGNLPEHLLLPVLSAALRSMPPKVYTAGDGATHAQYALQALLARLPEALHPLALRAHDPSVVDCRSFSISLADTPSAAPIVRALADDFAPHLTSLSLLECAMPPLPPAYGAETDRRVARMRADLHATFAPLAALTALKELHIMASQPREAMRLLSQLLPPVLGAALAQASNCTLTSLTVRCSPRNGATVGDVAVCMPALQELRSLDLSYCGAMHVHGDDAPLQRLARAMRTLSYLTHLALEGNPLANHGWDVLAPVAAGLPLQSLNLRSCCLCNSWDLCSDDTPQTLAAFTAMRSLCLSDNSISDVGARTASIVPQLTRLRFLPNNSHHTAAVHSQILGTVRAAASPELEDLRIGPLWQDGELEHTCAIFERCRRLRSVSLSLAPRPFAALPCALAHLFSLPRMEELSLVRVPVTPELRALSQCAALTHLTLCVDCASQDAHALKHMLVPLLSLQSLGIRFTRSSGEALAAAAVEGVSALTRLTKLCLVHCEIRPENRLAFAASLPCLTGLAHLSLSDRALGEAGVAAVAEGCRCMHGLTYLGLGVVEDQQQVVLAALLAALPSMRSLRRLRVVGADDGARKAVLQAVAPSVEVVLTGRDC